MPKIITSGVLFLCLISGLAAQSFEQSFVRGEEQMGAKHFQDALTSFDAALATASAKDQRALALWRIGQAQKALGNQDLYLEKLQASLNEAEIDEVKAEFEKVTGGKVAFQTAEQLAKSLRIGAGRVDVQVLFVTNSSRLTESGSRQAEEMAKMLQLDGISSSRFLVVGHTDSTGPAAFNLTLSRSRANAVLDRLVALGVGRGRLAAEGHGEAELKVTPELTPDDYAINRRVELKRLD